ncbi:MAG: hypothetical protein WCC04_14065 [Terriglobales bacterium]
MKALALALFLSFSVPQLQPPAKLSANPTERPAQRKGGRWYFAANGHAVYCYGPVMKVPQADGFPLTVATFCRGDQVMVPLKD